MFLKPYSLTGSFHFLVLSFLYIYITIFPSGPFPEKGIRKMNGERPLGKIGYEPE